MMLLTAVVSFLLGVFFAPVVRPMFRPMMLEIMKAWIVASDEARRATAQAREDMERSRKRTGMLEPSKPETKQFVNWLLEGTEQITR